MNWSKRIIRLKVHNFIEKPTTKLKKGMRKAKETWIEEQCQGIEEYLQKNNIKKAYQLVKELTRQNYYHPGQSKEMSHRRMRHSKEVDKVLLRIVNKHNNRRSQGARCPSTNNDSYPIMQEEVEAAVQPLKRGKSARVDNFPSELVQAGGETMIDMLLIICSKIWQTGEWPTPWT